MPDYNVSSGKKVEVTIYGKALSDSFMHTLYYYQDLDLQKVFFLTGYNLVCKAERFIMLHLNCAKGIVKMLYVWYNKKIKRKRSEKRQREEIMNTEKLNDKQLEAVYKTEGPLLILAGAGSGKTRVLTHRAAYLIQERAVNPYQIMAITFTNKAAGEMRERINNMVEFGAESIWVSTFHSSCVRILRRYIDRIGYGTNFTIYDSDDSKSIMKEICKRLQIDTKTYKEKSFLAAISHAKDELITPEVMAQNAEYAADFVKKKQAQVYREYQAVLKKNNALDFDDLIVKTVELFRTDAEVLNAYQERFRYIMVDEYQDTNTVQFELIRLLAGKYRNLCVVGDDDQSIYKFRGANIYNILNFEKHFPDAVTIKLEQNYRSTQTILDAANHVIANNMGRKEKTLWTENGAGSPIVFRQTETGYEEADFVTQDILRKTKRSAYRYRDCAVLYRTNAQSRIFEERFIVSNIPYKIVGGVNFYARKEIKDLLAYLKTVDNARDELAVRRIINVPKRGIGSTTLTRISDYATGKDIGFYEALKLAEEIPSIGKSAAKIRPFVLFIQKMRSKLPYLGVAELLKEIIEETGYVKELEAEETEEAQARIENIDELINKAADYDEMQEAPTLSGFLEEVALVADIDSLEEESDYVVLMTLHSAKGLEFPNVYLVGMEDGIFPSFMSIMADNPIEEIEEERRLAYVGITRAKEELAITCAKQRMVRGETRYNRVSRFVQEIPEELMSEPVKRKPAEKKAERTKDAVRPKRPTMRQQPSGQTMLSRAFESAKTAGTQLDYSIGDRVKHIKFGEGTVKNIVSGGRDFEVTVEFDIAGTKKMFATFAKLKRI